SHSLCCLAFSSSFYSASHYMKVVQAIALMYDTSHIYIYSENLIIISHRCHYHHHDHHHHHHH
ncbi:MAG: hypothetical protein ACKPKO_55525, partial [Candidatus Fonsibacter sp.]